MDQFIKVTGTEGKVGGYFCRLPPLNENTEYKETVRNWCDYSQCASLAQYSNGKRNADDRCHWGYSTIPSDI